MNKVQRFEVSRVGRRLVVPLDVVQQLSEGLLPRPRDLASGILHPSIVNAVYQVAGPQVCQIETGFVGTTMSFQLCR